MPGPIQAEVDRLGEGASRTLERLGDDTLTTIQKAGSGTVRTLQNASRDTFATIEKAGSDTVKTIYKSAGDATATYVKAWRDVGDQSKRSFKDVVDAGKAVVRFVENQAKAEINAARNAERRLRDGKVVDAMWGQATEPLRSGEENFAKATQESEVINAAASTAAAAYGGPAGAAAYAAWSTYRRTGNADMALRAGVLAGVTSQMGTSVSRMPSGTYAEITKKSVMAGAAGGIAVAAAGADEKAIKDGFLKSAGAVLVQGGQDKLKAYSPRAAGAVQTVQCISARDVDCLSNTTWARDAKGKILYDENGEPRIDTTHLDPKQLTGKWTAFDVSSAEAKKNAFIARISKLPDSDVIPILDNKWVLALTLNKDQDITYSTPTVVLTYVGEDPPFISNVDYAQTASPASTRPSRPTSNARAPGSGRATLFVGYDHPSPTPSTPSRIRYTCDALIISTEHILTAGECAGARHDNKKLEVSWANATNVVLSLRIASDRTSLSGESFPVNANPVEIINHFDYAIFHVDGNPSALAGITPVASETPPPGTRVALIDIDRGTASNHCRVTTVNYGVPTLLSFYFQCPGGFISGARRNRSGEFVFEETTATFLGYTRYLGIGNANSAEAIAPWRNTSGVLRRLK